MRTNCAQAGLHTSDRLLLEAVREVKVVRSHGGIEPATLDLTEKYLPLSNSYPKK